MGREVTYTNTLYVQCCCNCGIEFGVPDEWDDKRRNDHKTFYCPNGHPQSYQGKTRAEELAEKLEREKQNSEWWRKRKLEEEKRAEAYKRQRDAHKGHVTRLKKRVAKGKCPACSCQFVNLAAHMTKRHPDYVQEEAGAEVRPEADRAR